MDYVRDYAMYAAIFGIFGFSWFGWAQENPRASWRKWLGIASAAPFLVGLAGIYWSVTHWHERTALAEAGAFRAYLTFVFAEVLLAAVGAFLFIRFKRKDYIAPWIAFIVGVHFFWLKSVFQDTSLYALAILLIGVSVLSPIAAKKWQVANSAITGIGAGTVLFGFAISGAVRFLLAQAQ
ncbi:hypothetical protein ACFFNY_11550 [Paenibacillus hodogayensis]|uniref:Uncharacterized protein n=1 Tax=Paenibacillus hodogayensis TaxID=279208 RepID=A0ABV5VV61_9BACL